MKNRLRLWAAFVCPVALLQWINMDRCYVQVNNDADGVWTVQIGIRSPCVGATLRSALYAAINDADTDPDWMWTKDFLNG